MRWFRMKCASRERLPAREHAKMMVLEKELSIGRTRNKLIPRQLWKINCRAEYLLTI
jgi:hypothetical protein